MPMKLASVLGASWTQIDIHFLNLQTRDGLSQAPAKFAFSCIYTTFSIVHGGFSMLKVHVHICSD